MAIRRLVERALSRLGDPLIAAATRPRPEPGTATILTFHSITPAPREKIDLAPERLERLLDAIEAGPADVVPIGDVAAALDGIADPRPRLALTFDDAYPDFAAEAVPRLARRGLPAAVGVVTAYADSGAPFPFASGHGRRSMRWDELARLRREHGDLVTLVNHSHRHLDLTRLGADQLAEEIGRAQERFAAELGIRPEVFVYPFGFCDEAARRLVAREFALGLTGRWGTNRPGADRAALARITCFDLDGAATRRLKIAGRTTAYQLARDLAAPLLRAASRR